MLKKLTVMALALIIALASVCLPSFADSGADISAAVQSGDAPGESATQAEPGGAEAGPGASAGADGEERTACNHNSYTGSAGGTCYAAEGGGA